MADWRHVMAHLANDVEQHFDALKNRLGERLGSRDPIMIAAYRGYGTSSRLYLKGRVLENKRVAAAADDDTLWDNLVNMYRRFESDEAPGAQVLARFQGIEHRAVADEEGYFEVAIEPAHRLPADRLWHPVELELLSPESTAHASVRATGQVLVPPSEARFGVISDIDDTVVQTDAAHLLRMARTVFMGNARTRLAFGGAAAFYRALHAGVNPIWYVSSSPWNMYDLLSDFFQLHEFPEGPILLRDWGITENEFFQTRHREYKLDVVRRLLDLYPDLPFVLIGDSGQEDPEIYRELVGLYPRRILAVYIRDVSHDDERRMAVTTLAGEVAEAGSTLILARETLPLAQHAAGQCWISPDTLTGIQVEQEADAAPRSPLETNLDEQELRRDSQDP